MSVDHIVLLLIMLALCGYVLAGIALMPVLRLALGRGGIARVIMLALAITKIWIVLLLGTALATRALGSPIPYISLILALLIAVEPWVVLLLLWRGWANRLDDERKN